MISKKTQLAIVLPLLTLLILFVIFYINFIQEQNRMASDNPFGDSEEAVECMRYGGAWGGGKNETSSCSKGRGAPFDVYGNCPEGHVIVEQTYPFTGNACIEEEYFKTAKCEKYWSIYWNEQGYGCRKMNEEQIDSMKIDEILENQKKILESLQENQRSPENLSNSYP